MKTIGKYTVIEELGRGGMSTVYLANDPDTRQDVAIKMLTSHNAEDAQAQIRLIREAQMVMSLEHPAIVPVMGFDRMGDRFYIIMQYMPGGSLRQQLYGVPFSLAETLELLAPIGSALDAVHAEGMIHRDVKPHNILLDEDGKAYLSDFGVARLLEPEGKSEQTITFAGTPEFMAPEQAGSGSLTAQTDIYQLGVTAFQMLTGQRPFSGSSFHVVLQHINEPLPSAEALNPDLPPGTDAVLNRVMSKSPDARYPSALAFLEALADLDAELTTTQPFAFAWQSNQMLKGDQDNLTSDPPIVGIAPPLRPARRSPMLVPMIAVIVFALLGAGVLFFAPGVFDVFAQSSDSNDGTTVEVEDGGSFFAEMIDAFARDSEDADTARQPSNEAAETNDDPIISGSDIAGAAGDTDSDEDAGDDDTTNTTDDNDTAPPPDNGGNNDGGGGNNGGGNDGGGGGNNPPPPPPGDGGGGRGGDGGGGGGGGRGGGGGNGGGGNGGGGGGGDN